MTPMRIARWYSNDDIRIEEVPTPEPGDGELLVKVIACGICGSDIVEWYRGPRAPLVPGHELGAEVVEVGKGVTGFKPGDRICVPPKVPCMRCRHCLEGRFPVCSEVPERLPGAFTEYVLVPASFVEHHVYRLPEGMSYDQGTFIEPLACVVRAQRLAGIKEGQTVLVLGCGMSGLLQIELAKRKGCAVIATDVSTARLERAARLGADATVDATGNVEESLLAAAGRKADVVMVCTSALPAIEQAWECVDTGGVVVFFTVPDPGKQVTLPINDFWRREIRVITSYYCGPPDIAEAIDLIREGTVAVDALITHRLPLDDIAEGFRLVVDGGESLKVIIRPHG